ncbi:MAG TPA: hypothetical protein VGC26_08780, partial [Afipia sp.]
QSAMKYLHLSAQHAADIELVSGARLRKTGISTDGRRIPTAFEELVFLACWKGFFQTATLAGWGTRIRT